MSWGTYFGGLAILLAELLALSVTAVAVRRRWLDDWRGAPARLAEATSALGVLYAVGLVLGAIGLFRRGPMALVVVLVGLASAAWLWRHPVGRDAPPAPRERGSSSANDGTHVGRLPRWVSTGVVVQAVAALAVVLTTAVWSIHTASSYRRGIYDGDSIWYHGPFAARFVQTGWLTRILYVNSEPLVSFFPANSELLHAWFALPFHRDVLSPALNLAWLALFLLAGWCVGERWNRGAVGLAAAAVIAGTPVMSATQAGTDRNDIVGLALLVTALALLVQPGRRPAAMALGGVACGLALGVKTSLLVPAALLVAMGVVVSLLAWPAGTPAVRWKRWTVKPRWLGLGCWLVPAAGFGAYWYLRNWARVGNPLPWLSVHAGPIRFESPPLPDAALGTSALTNRFGHPGWWAQMVRPGLRVALGPLWPVLLGLAVVGFVAGIAAGGWNVRGFSRSAAAYRGTTNPEPKPAPGVSGARLAALLAVVAVVAAAAYTATPNSAPLAPPPAQAALFLLNFRYALPALILALLVLAVGRWGEPWLPVASVVALGVVAVTEPFPGSLRRGWEWRVTGGDVVVGLVALGVAVVVVLLAAFVATLGTKGLRPRSSAFGRHAPRRHAPRWLLLGVIVLGVAGLAGRSGADRYLERRYAGSPPYVGAEFWSFGDQVRHSRIGVMGDPFQYPYVGPSLSNRVGYVGVTGSHGAIRDARTCREWHTALRADRVDYVVISRGVFNGLAGPPPQLAWTRQIPGAIEIRSGPDGGVFHLTRGVGPSGCA